MNIRYDDTVHAGTENTYGGQHLMPVCGSADIPAWEPEETADAVTCRECEAIVG